MIGRANQGVESDHMTEDRNLIAICVGNTRTRLGRFDDGTLARSAAINNASLATIVEKIVEWSADQDGKGHTDKADLIMASVNDEPADRLASALEDQLSVEVYRIGGDLPIPVAEQLDPETITGVDRLLNAAAAYKTVGQACIIIDAGTAITVDFVDGEGTFQGGAIAPGARMQLAALAQGTAALPELEFQRPAGDAFGRSTSQAMLNGVFHGIRGMVQRLVEQYAEQYGAFPIVIATGGDAAVLFEGDALIDRIVPELTLLGISATARHSLRADDADADCTR